MFERYSDAARQAVFVARAEAGTLGSREISTEHFLLALLQESDGPLRQVLGDEAAAAALEQEIRAGLTDPNASPLPVSVDLALSHEVKRALAYAGEESERLNERRIGSSHLLLGLLRESGCEAAQMLTRHGVTREKVLDQLEAAPGPCEDPLKVSRERLHALVDSLPEEAMPHAYGALNHLQVWPPPQPQLPPRMAELRRQMQERAEGAMRAGGRGFAFAGSGGGWSSTTPGSTNPNEGRHTMHWTEPGAQVSETHLFINGQEIVIEQRVESTPESGRAVIHHMIRDPNGKEHTYRTQVELPPPPEQ